MSDYITRDEFNRWVDKCDTTMSAIFDKINSVNDWISNERERRASINGSVRLDFEKANAVINSLKEQVAKSEQQFTDFTKELKEEVIRQQNIRLKKYGIYLVALSILVTIALKVFWK